MMKLLAFGTVTAASLAFAEIRTETRELTAFSELEAGGGVELEIVGGDKPELTIRGEDKVVADYTTRVQNGKLLIERKSNWGKFHSHAVQIRVTAKNLKRVDVSGGVDLQIQGGLARDFTLEASGGVEAKAAQLDLNSINVDASGGASIDLSGQAGKADFELSGGVELRAKDLKTKEVSIDASGGVSARVYAAEKIDGEASGAANVRVYGSPRQFAVETSGASSARRSE